MTYHPLIALSPEIRANYAATHERDTVQAFLFTYLDGHNIVLIRNSDNLRADLRAAIHQFGESMPATPVLPGCPHLGGVFGIVLQVSTGRVVLVRVNADLSRMS